MIEKYKILMKEDMKIIDLDVLQKTMKVIELRYAYGMISTTPQNKDHHYLIFDIDTKDETKLKKLHEDLEDRCIEYVGCETEKGYHYYTNYIQSNKYGIAWIMSLLPYVDKNYIQIGIERGYWFLEAQSMEEQESIQLMYQNECIINKEERIVKKQVERSYKE